MANNINTKLDVKKVPRVVGVKGRRMLKRCLNVIENTKWPLYIVGPSGSGKSIIAMNIAKEYAMKHKVDAYYVQLSPEQTKTSLILGLRLKNGSLVPENGIVADCMENGGIIIVDEATHSMQEILLMFNSILDRTAVTAIGDKIVYAADSFRIVFCSNTSTYAGNVKLPQSFAQRLVAFNFEYPGQNDEVEIVKRIVDDELECESDVPDNVINYIVGLMREVRSEEYPLSVRNAAIATVMLALEYKEAGKTDDYFTMSKDKEAMRRTIATRIFGESPKDVTIINGSEVQEVIDYVSSISVKRFKEIILQSFMYYLDIDMGFFDSKDAKSKLMANII